MIIYIQEGQRRIPIQYASRVRGRRMYQGGQTFLPLRVNQAGVIPIIFAVSILLFPSQIASYFVNSPSPIGDIAQAVVTWLGQGSLAVRRSCTSCSPSGSRTSTRRSRSSRTRPPSSCARTAASSRASARAARRRTTSPGSSPGSPWRARCSWASSRPAAVHRPRPAAVPGPRPGWHGHPHRGQSVVVETMKQLEAQLLIRQYEGFIARSPPGVLVGVGTPLGPPA